MQVITPEMAAFLKQLQEKVVVGLVGGSDLVKIKEQMANVGDGKNYCVIELAYNSSFYIIKCNSVH